MSDPIEVSTAPRTGWDRLKAWLRAKTPEEREAAGRDVMEGANAALPEPVSGHEAVEMARARRKRLIDDPLEQNR